MSLEALLFRLLPKGLFDTMFEYMDVTSLDCTNSLLCTSSNRVHRGLQEVPPKHPMLWIGYKSLLDGTIGDKHEQAGRRSWYGTGRGIMLNIPPSRSLQSTIREEYSSNTSYLYVYTYT